MQTKAERIQILPEFLKKLRKSDIIQWLNSKGEFISVGECQNPKKCLLAEFLTDQGFQKVAVFTTVVYAEGQYFPSPVWFSKVISNFDGLYFKTGNKYPKKMEALGALID